MLRCPFEKFSKIQSEKTMNVVTGDESWIHFFEPHCKISNQVWLTKDARNAMQKGLQVWLCMPYFSLLND